MQNDINKIINFGKHKIRCPTLFASYRLGDFPGAGLKFFPWEITKTEALLINAYDFERPQFKKQLNNGWNPAISLDFHNKPILIDSGAYYFLKKTNIDITPEKILENEIKSQADVGVVLDHPFSFDAPDIPQRINTTVKNTKLMYKAHRTSNPLMNLMPVIHGHSEKEIRNCITRIRKIFESDAAQTIKSVGIGSIASLAKIKRSQHAVEIIQTVRRLLPDIHIHCFSMGSPSHMLLAYYSGADTVDSQSWILNAAFKYALLPGITGGRMAPRIYKNEGNLQKFIDIFDEQLLGLALDENFSTKNWITGEEVDLTSKSQRKKYIINLIDRKSNENIHNRACHNLWCLNIKKQKAREAIKEDDFETFIESRLTQAQYRMAYDYAKTKNK